MRPCGTIADRVSPSASSLRLLDQLARRHGLTAAPQPVPPSVPFDLAEAGALLSLDEPELERALAAAVDGAAVDDLASLVACACGRTGPVALLPDAASAIAAMVQAAHAARPGRVIACGDALRHGGETSVERVPFADAAATLALDGPVSLVVVEPFEPGARTAAAAARALGAMVAVDASRAAFRTGQDLLDDTWSTADFVVLGPALAAGLPCHAVVGAPAHDALDPVTRTVAASVLAALRSTPPHAALTATGAQILAAIEAAAKTHDIQLVVHGTPALPWLSFAGQEDAPPELIEHHFQRELAAVGVHARGPLLWPSAVRRDAAARQRCAAAFAHALLRLRVLFVEYNSHLSGGLPWPFPGGGERLRTRGLTFYRYPRRAPVDVGPVDAAMRIAFSAGELGAVTSSGFYVPTRLQGDVVLTIRYVLRQWHSGPDSACLGLFLQNEASTARYYAQIASTAAAPEQRVAAAGLQGEVVGRRPVDGDGWLRLVRSGGEVVAFHRAAGSEAFTELGRCAATADPLVAGCKIWSKVRTDGLVADLFELEIDAALASEQPELLPARPDPRHERRSG